MERKYFLGPIAFNTYIYYLPHPKVNRDTGDSKLHNSPLKDVVPAINKTPSRDESRRISIEPSRDGPEPEFVMTSSYGGM